jgi:hypothetical protein
LLLEALFQYSPNRAGRTSTFDDRDEQVEKKNRNKKKEAREIIPGLEAVMSEEGSEKARRRE